MDKEEMKSRTKAFALRVLKVVKSLPDSAKGRVVAYQLAKSGTSVGANYRAVCRARSNKEFVAKLGIVPSEVRMRS
ncbi:MAG: four helix bundle protein [Akkermansiaceae bacterium]